MKAEPRLMEDRVGMLTDGFVREVPLMKPSCLAELLDNPLTTQFTLVIDCRPFTAYNTLHILTARNAYCPPILLRRKSRPSAISLDFIVGDSGVSQKLLAGNYTNVVLYDEEGISRTISSARTVSNYEINDNLKLSTSCKNYNAYFDDNVISNKDSSHINLVLDCLYNQLPEDQQDRVHCLEGGFREFLSTCPSQLLASQNLPSVTAPSQIITSLALPIGRKSRDLSGLDTEIGLKSGVKVEDSALFPSYRGSSLSRVRSANDICLMGGDVEHNKISGSAERLAVISTDTVRYHSSKDKGDPAEVLPWLYIGNAYHASQIQRLLDMDITALLNVAEIDEISYYSSSRKSTGVVSSDVQQQQRQLSRAANERKASSVPFCHMSIPIVDSATADISGKFPDAINFIENVRQSGGRCLVHCRAGISRSATICMAYLMKHLHLSLDDAHDFLKQRRRLISPNLNFLRQLSEFETTLKAATDKELQSREVSETIPTCLQQLQQLAKEQLLDRKPLQRQQWIVQQNEQQTIEQTRQHVFQQNMPEIKIEQNIQMGVDLSQELKQQLLNHLSTTSFSESSIKQSTPVPLMNRPSLSLSCDVGVVLNKPSNKDIIELSDYKRDDQSQSFSQSSNSTTTSQSITNASNVSKLNNVFSSIPTIHVNDVTDCEHNLKDLGSRDLNGLGVATSYCSPEILINSRKRRLPTTTELCITQFTCSPKSSVATALPTKTARFTFDFPMVSALASSPALCQSPLLSPS